ncbi:MAG: hypothetical protein GF408_03055 [Candidatus Omnitrophica bacterium]|nr:hypothetical protein [Candidatus Omnitrophota bacterium]
MQTKQAVKVERMYTLNGEGPTRAFCDLLLMDTFVVKGLRVIQGKDNLFLGFPRNQGKDGKWYETFFPVAKDTRKGLEEFVLDEYRTRTGAGS